MLFPTRERAQTPVTLRGLENQIPDRARGSFLQGAFDVGSASHRFPVMSTVATCCWHGRSFRTLRPNSSYTSCKMQWLLLVRIGPILNFLGDGAFLFPDRSDVSRAAWIVDHYPQLAAVLPEIRAAQTKPPEQRRADYERLAAMGLGTAGLFETVVSSTPFGQVMNDLRLYFGDSSLGMYHPGPSNSSTARSRSGPRAACSMSVVPMVENCWSSWRDRRSFMASM